MSTDGSSITEHCTINNFLRIQGMRDGASHTKVIEWSFLVVR